MHLGDEIRSVLYARGADMVGFANLCELPAAARQNLPFAISVGVARNPQIIGDINEGPSQRYYDEYRELNALLLDLAQVAAQFLEDRRYNATPLHPTDGENLTTLATPLPHKTVATRAGLGWIGKCALLVTEEFGSAIRFNTVLTDAILPAEQPINESRCGECAECADACPVQAITGSNWRVGIARETLVDAHACKQHARAVCQKSLGIAVSMCGLCILSCPWTQRYISENATRTDLDQ